jgi:hypothetical protein
MVKTFVKYLLSVCILLSGYVHLSAHQYHAFYTPKKNRKGSELSTSGTDTSKNCGTLVVISSFGHEKQNDVLNEPFIENEVEEDDESTSSRKHSGAISIFSSRSLAYFFKSSKKLAPYTTCLSNISSCRYIVFQVFRI